LCPACSQPLIALELEGIEVDHCPACNGTWLDAGELEHICERAGASAEPLRKTIRAAGKGRRGKRRCPRCQGRLRTLTVGHSPAIEIDRCSRGHGLWFDAGEIETLVEECSGDEAGILGAFLQDLLHHTLSMKQEGESQWEP